MALPMCVFACVLCPRWSCSWRGWGRGRRPSRRPSLRRPASRGSSRSVGERWTKKHTRDRNRRRNTWINKVSLNITSKSGQRRKESFKGRGERRWRGKDKREATSVQKMIFHFFSRAKIHLIEREKGLFNEKNVNQSVKLYVSDKNVHLRLAPINLHILTCKKGTFIVPAAKT